MTLVGIETHQQFQPTQSLHNTRKPATAVSASGDESGRTRSQQERGGPSPIQDQVTLSKEAQALAASNGQASKNGTSEQAPSHFDR